MDLKKDFKHLIPKLFWARRKSEFATQASTYDKNTDCVGVFWQQVSKFVFTLFSSIYASDRHRQAVVTVKIYNSGLDCLCATHFLTLHPSLGFDRYFGNHWARSTNQPLCNAVATSRPIS